MNSELNIITSNDDHLQWASCGGRLGLHSIPGAWEASILHGNVPMRALLELEYQGK